MNPTYSRHRLGRWLCLVLCVSSTLFVLTGCAHEEVPVSPNAESAAPARAPGIDPHAHKGKPPAGLGK